MPFLFSPLKRHYLSHSLYFLRKMQDVSSASCESIFEQIITTSLKSSNKKIPSKYQRAAEKIVYRIALDLFDSPRYRNLFGLPTPIGEQLLHICRNSLDYFREAGYITEEEYIEHSDYLNECNLSFEKYGIY